MNNNTKFITIWKRLHVALSMKDKWLPVQFLVSLFILFSLLALRDAQLKQENILFFSPFMWLAGWAWVSGQQDALLNLAYLVWALLEMYCEFFHTRFCWDTKCPFELQI